MLKVSERFVKSIPREHKKAIFNKIMYFKEALEQAENQICKLPNGCGFVRVIGTDIYKIRLNNGDRILFIYDKDYSEYDLLEKGEKVIVLIEYCKHDKQIAISKRINYSNFLIDEAYFVGEGKTEYLDDDTNSTIYMGFQQSTLSNFTLNDVNRIANELYNRGFEIDYSYEYEDVVEEDEDYIYIK